MELLLPEEKFLPEGTEVSSLNKSEDDLKADVEGRSSGADLTGVSKIN